MLQILHKLKTAGIIRFYKHSNKINFLKVQIRFRARIDCG